MKSQIISTRSGQSLLVIVLLISVVFTLIAASSFRLTKETQSTKSQAESIRTLAAADSGIERGLQQVETGGVGTSTFTALGVSLKGIDATKSKVAISNAGGSTFFESPNLKNSEQYTYYLADYNEATGVFSNHHGSSYYGGADVWFYFGSAGLGNCASPRTAPALEATLIYNTTNSIKRFLVDPCTTGVVITAEPGTKEGYPTLGSPITLDPSTATTYNYRLLIQNLGATSGSPSYPLPKLVFLRVFFASSKIGVQRHINNTSINLPNQGKIIRSEAYATSGASKIVTLFQSNPQIPADLFVTTF